MRPPRRAWIICASGFALDVAATGLFIVVVGPLVRPVTPPAPKPIRTGWRLAIVEDDMYHWRDPRTFHSHAAREEARQAGNAETLAALHALRPNDLTDARVAELQRALTTTQARCIALMGLFTLTATYASAAPQLESFGAWTVRTSNDDGVNLAFVTSDSGQSLMLRCDGNGCGWILLSTNPCTAGVKSNVLVSPSAVIAGAGNLSLKAECLDQVNKYYRLAITPYDDLTNLLDQLLRNTQDGYIGFAFALEGGQFRVSRFSLSGMQPAMVRLQKLNEQSGYVAPRDKTTPSRGFTPKDQIL
jgi:hypothetical protein